MATTDGFPDGAPEEDTSSLSRELKILNDSLRSLVASLNKTTNNDIFSKKDYLDRTLEKFGGSLKEKIYKPMHDHAVREAASTKDFINKTQKILEQTSQYIKEELGIKDITKKQMQLLLLAEKERMEFQKQILQVTKNQDYLLSSIHSDYERSRVEKAMDLEERRRSSYSMAPEERMVNKAVNKSNTSMLPESFAQAFMQKGPSGLSKLARGISMLRGGRSRDQFKKTVSAKQTDAESDVLKKLGLYEYDTSNALDIKDLLSSKNEYGTYSNLDKEKHDLVSGYDELESSIPVEMQLQRKRLEGVDFPLRKERRKQQSSQSSGGVPKFDNIIPFPSRQSYKKPAGESFSFGGEESMAGVAFAEKKEESYSTTNITAQQVKKVLGNQGIGYIYIGNLLEKWLDPTKNDDPSKSDEFKEFKIDGGGGGGGVIADIVTAVLALLATGAFIKKQLEIEKAKTDARVQALVDTGVPKEDAVRINQYQEQMNSLSQGAIPLKTPEQIAEEAEYTRKWEKIKKGMLRSGSKEETYYNIISGMIKSGEFKNDPVKALTSLGKNSTYKGDIAQFHKGGVVKLQEGEVVLPVAESEYGLSSGILQKTQDGGMSFNKNMPSSLSDMGSSPSMNTQRLESLLEQLLVAVNTNLVKAVKETKTVAKPPIPSLNLSTMSFRSQ